MPASTNKRIFFAIEQVQIDGGSTSGDNTGFTTLYGLQDAGSRTSFNLSQVFELGQGEVYEHVEDIPDVEVSMSKVLDGRELIWHKCTGGTATSPTLRNRAKTNCAVRMGLWADTNDSATGSADVVVETSGMYVSSLGYSFPVGGEFTESVTLVGNDRIWKGDTRLVETDAVARAALLTMTGSFSSNTDSPTGTGGVNRRENLLWDYTATGLDVNGMVAEWHTTILPPEVYGISSSGTNEADGDFRCCHVTNISVGADLGREPLFELGSRTPYYRVSSPIIETTCDIEVIATSGDMISATEAGILTNVTTCGAGTNLSDATIRVATCEGTHIYLGSKNKLQNVEFGGGDTGGGNATATYSYVGFNTFTVLHPAEAGQQAVAGLWWNDPETHLLDT